MASDDFHNPPADTRSGLGGDTFVSGISTRTRSDTVGSGPLLSPKIELKSDERNLLSYEDNNEDDIDIDDKVTRRTIVDKSWGGGRRGRGGGGGGRRVEVRCTGYRLLICILRFTNCT